MNEGLKNYFANYKTKLPYKKHLLYNHHYKVDYSFHTEVISEFGYKGNLVGVEHDDLNSSDLVQNMF